MEGLTIFYIVAAVVIVGLVVYYLKQKGKGTSPKVPTSEGPSSESPKV